MKTLISNKLQLSALALVLGTLGAACGVKAPTQELLSARAAYDVAAKGPAGKVEQDKLLTAKQALDKAEKEHLEDAQSNEEKHFAYIAERVANLADTYGKASMNQRAAAAAKAEHDQLSESRRVSAEGKVVKTQAELDNERTARMKAEASLQAALRSLAEFAKVKEEPRGMVITLNGSVLFTTGKWELLPAAQKKLDDVAKALADLDPKRAIVVEGHTDSQGPDDANQTLSNDRAKSVRDYLVSRGVAEGRISSVGKGEGTPIGENTSAEGRANNRRVEIVIAPAK